MNKPAPTLKDEALAAVFVLVCFLLPVCLWGAKGVLVFLLLVALVWALQHVKLTGLLLLMLIGFHS